MRRALTTVDLARRGLIEVTILSLAAIGGGLLGLAKHLSRELPR